MAAGEIEKVTIVITTRNAPFCDEHADPERNRPDWAVESEVARILRGIAERSDLLGIRDTRSVRDDFGHEVGTITIEREKDEP
jgi:hypothetical protein